LGIRYGDKYEILIKIDHGRLQPSKNLVDHLASLLQGNRDFKMIDDQKVVYESVLDLAGHAEDGAKQVLLVVGGPGTAKSVATCQ
jgi:hypothetical protein